MTSHRDPQELEREVDLARSELTGVVSELDRRRHALFDWRLQLRQHAASIALVAAGTLLLAGGMIAASIWRRRRRERPLQRARRLREAVSRVIEHPELVARPQPSIGKKALAAAVSGAAGVAAKAVTQRLASQGRAA
jgi:hypothetical protein